ncbi:MAG: bifunctional proline dehydrogenase/L-glutamate gamma-semialdehyde dehydrogenase PutA [Rhodospirillaceae bacterium]|nr:bifunctional proline dehydrogenase/L-glutamate gamma-semialdehyde dehydrogenase PutA [Rhodospirillaceae bacterium]
MVRFVFDSPAPDTTPARRTLRRATRRAEGDVLSDLLPTARLAPDGARRVQARAAEWVEKVRARRGKASGLDSFLQVFDLSSREGIALMCLAEALLRIPDGATADALIRDTLGGADWRRHLGASDSAFVNAATWALMLTGGLIAPEDDSAWLGTVKSLAQRVGEPVIRAAVREAMAIMGQQFVMGRTIDEALSRARTEGTPRTRYSFDMLGEAVLTAPDAARCFDAYLKAIKTLGRSPKANDHLAAHGISVKLSALHPRYETAQIDRVHRELIPRVMALARAAKRVNIGLTIDAEEADRLDLSLDVIAALAKDPALKDWDGLGLAVQAYQRRALPLIAWLTELAHQTRRRLMTRLVKGAYWDSEIKRAQEAGLDDYPVFTRKTHTDVSYLACARHLLADARAFYPCFATHNAHTAAAVLEMAAGRTDFEFQRLHGMGRELYDVVLAEVPEAAVRVYAPVGSHEDLLAYLVRRLLENGANTSFVNRLLDEKLPVATIVADPVERVLAPPTAASSRIPLPGDLFGAERTNSAGIDLADPETLAALKTELNSAPNGWNAWPLVGGQPQPGLTRRVANPANLADSVGSVTEADAATALRALDLAHSAHAAWDTTPAMERAACLERAADAMEAERPALMALAIREAGKTISDAVAEVREAVDFLRYYAARARADFAEPLHLPGPTGETNRLMLRGRGVFLCISPWNFPLAIFTGQVAAALAAGNTVIAKPAEQTPLMAAAAVRLLHRAGVPADALHLVPGDGPALAAPLLSDRRLTGVAFTGSTAAAAAINRALAARAGPLAVLIAETGGVNAMIVDSSALPEQVTRDAVASAFRSAGQRCSALRVLCLQDDIADKTIAMLAGAMAELNVGDPALLATDVGPVIDGEALARLQAHATRMDREGKKIFEIAAKPEWRSGTFFAPRAYEIPSLAHLTEEVFGPILHVVRYRGSDLDAVIEQINATGYGLTASIHSRVDSRAASIAARLKVGNIYINRNQVGAVVGVQPFGGEGLSGTGPKAGGPRYLHRFALERTVSIDTTAKGGNAALLAADPDQR